MGSDWKSEAVARFPELAGVVRDSDTRVSVFGAALSRWAREAIAEGAWSRAERAFAFAEELSRHPRKEHWNGIAMGFYKTFMRDAEARDHAPRLMSRERFDELAPLFVLHIGALETARVRTLYARPAAASVRARA